jgi:hypothetical protein
MSEEPWRRQFITSPPDDSEEFLTAFQENCEFRRDTVVQVWHPDGSSDIGAQAPAQTPIATTPRQVKRRHNGLDYAANDMPLIREMRAMIMNKAARSAEDAARAVVKHAVGGGKDGSKVKRLARRYHLEYPAEPVE